MDWQKNWSRAELAEFFIIVRGAMKDKAGALVDRDWVSLHTKTGRPVSEMKQLTEVFSHLILGAESTPEQFVSAVQNIDASEMEAHRELVSTVKMRRATKPSARAVESTVSAEVARTLRQRQNTTSAVRNPEESLNDSMEAPPELTDVAHLLAFALGTAAPASPPSERPKGPNDIDSYMTEEHSQESGMKPISAPGPSNKFHSGPFAGSFPSGGSIPMPLRAQDRKSANRKPRPISEEEAAAASQSPPPRLSTPAEMEELKQALTKVLESPRVRRWCIYEWFYPNVDQNCFQESDFLSLLHSLHLNDLEYATRGQWNVVRRCIGNPRRMSKRFFQQEREKLDQNRLLVRSLRPKYTHHTQMALASAQTVESKETRASRHQKAAPQTSQGIAGSSPSIASAYDGHSPAEGSISQNHLGLFSSSSVASSSSMHHSTMYHPHHHQQHMDSSEEGQNAAPFPDGRIRLPVTALGASDAQGVTYITKDKSQMITKNSRVLVWTLGITGSNHPGGSFSASGRRRRYLSDPVTDDELSDDSFDHGGMDQGAEGDPPSDAMDVDENSYSLADSSGPSSSRVDSHGTEAHKQVDAATKLKQRLASMGSELIPGRLVKSKKDNKYYVQLYGTLVDGSNAITVEDTHIMSCDVNRASAKRKPVAVPIYNVEFNLAANRPRLHSTVSMNDSLALWDSVMLQTPEFSLQYDYQLVAAVMLLLDWKDLTITAMSKFLETTERSKRTLDQVEAGTKQMAAASIATIRSRYDSNRRNLRDHYERLQVINEQLTKYRRYLAQRKNTVAASHIVAQSIYNTRDTSDLAVNKIQPISPATADTSLMEGVLASSPSVPSSSSMDVSNDHPPDSSLPANIHSYSSLHKNHTDRTASQSTAQSMATIPTAMDVTPSNPNEIASSAPSAHLTSSNQPKSALAAASPEKDDMKDLEMESMMALAFLTSTPSSGSTSAPVTGSGAPSQTSSLTLPLQSITTTVPASSFSSSDPAPLWSSITSSPSPPSSAHPRMISDGGSAPHVSFTGESIHDLVPSISPQNHISERDNDNIRDKVTVALSLLKTFTQEGISAEVLSTSVKMLLDILRPNNMAADPIFQSIQQQCDQMMEHLEAAE
jgi:hypothetical protein